MTNYRRGFTLVEVIVVLVIIGLLLGVAVPNVVKYVDKANARVCEAARVNIERQGLALTGFSYETGSPLAYADVLSGILAGNYPTYFSSSDITCPSGGTYSVAYGRVLCSKHGGDGDGGGGNVSGNIAVDENYNYGSNYPEFETGGNYSIGQIVKVGNALVMARAALNNDQGNFTNKNSWLVIGTTDGKPIDISVFGNKTSTSQLRFAPGVVVKVKENNEDVLKMAITNNGLADSGVLVKLESGSAYIKPTSTSLLASAMLNNDKGSPFLENGGYYYNNNGVVFKYNGESGKQSQIKASTINNGTWTPMSNVYLANVNYKAGDTVWYNGRNYTANSDTTAAPTTSAWTIQ